MTLLLSGLSTSMLANTTFGSGATTAASFGQVEASADDLKVEEPGGGPVSSSPTGARRGGHRAVVGVSATRSKNLLQVGRHDGDAEDPKSPETDRETASPPVKAGDGFIFKPPARSESDLAAEREAGRAQLLAGHRIGRQSHLEDDLQPADPPSAYSSAASGVSVVDVQHVDQQQASTSTQLAVAKHISASAPTTTGPSRVSGSGLLRRESGKPRRSTVRKSTADTAGEKLLTNFLTGDEFTHLLRKRTLLRSFATFPLSRRAVDESIINIVHPVRLYAGMMVEACTFFNSVLLDDDPAAGPPNLIMAGGSDSDETVPRFERTLDHHANLTQLSEGMPLLVLDHRAQVDIGPIVISLQSGIVPRLFSGLGVVREMLDRSDSLLSGGEVEAEGEGATSGTDGVTSSAGSSRQATGPRNFIFFPPAYASQ